MSQSDLVPLLDDPDDDERPIHSFPSINTSNCPRNECRGPVCECENFNIDVIEQAPLISFQSDTPNTTYFTDVHCHGFRPIFSNKNARRKLTIASIVCLIFVVAEVVGKYCS